MKMTLARKILLGFIACTMVLFGVAIFSFKNNEKFIESNIWVDHTNQVMYEFEQIRLYSVDAETGARGYVITGDEHYLEPFTNASAKIAEHIEKVRELTSDNPIQQRNVNTLEKELTTHMDHLKGYIDLRKKDVEKARKIVAGGDGKRIEDGIRALIDKARGVEQTLLVERRQASDDDARNFNVVFAVLLLIIITVLFSVYFIITANLRALKKAETETSSKNWLLAGNTALNSKTQGEKEVNELAQEVVNQLTSYMKAQIGAIYLTEGGQLNLVGSYAFQNRKDNSNVIKLGQGLVGQAALEKKSIIFSPVPDDYIKINSGLGNSSPKNIIVFPFQYAGQLKGVIEIGSINQFSELDLQLLDLVSENIGIAFNSSQSRTKLKELLEETQRQAEELQTQQEEMKQMNEELEEQAQNLKQQQEELQMTNEELEEQTQSLEFKNKEVEGAKYDIEQKTKQLEVSSKYKSEFLANMSHELRTPLNSLLILSKDLSDNKKKNLDPDQVESAEIIYKSGQDLLVLINEVLDLSKIEAGKMAINIERVPLRAFSDELLRDFKHNADRKGLKLSCTLDPELPEAIRSDSQRLNQILKNLLSNAIKFTEKGSVNIGINRYTESTLIISVSDTGIGIQEDKQMAIFEAFQQADGGTSRKFGGTGLGLSISRELAKLLGAEIKVKSKPNEGSTFSLIIPVEIHQAEESARSSAKEPVLFKGDSENGSRYLNYPAVEDDRDSITKDDKVVLVIEDDLNFAAILLKQANYKGFKCLSAATGEDGLILASKYKPHAIILDIDLPGINGHRVLAELKANPTVRHIPVHIVSVHERSLDSIKEGAIECLTKPVSKKELEDAFTRIENFANRKMKTLLIIEDDENSRKTIRKLIGNGDVKCLDAESGKAALTIFTENHVDCIVLDLGLPDINGFELIYKLENIKDRQVPPIIVYTGKELTKEENNELQNYAESIIIKGVKSEERLLDETALFLHRTISNLPASKQQIINNLYDKEAIFRAKKILLVDDDMRNVFALSKILKERGMEIVKAENGKNALEMLSKHPHIDLVLMDIMMPEMDGYEAMKQIRSQTKFKNLPVIALTAKAMKDDKRKCIEAGANDYIAKPIDIERLLSLMRVWLSN
ncbi:Signal transduction histidine kinase [Chryseolinea serpens]|uniref:histidine kinase n=2 Tax=Chryseolinea serpens TaxID=947013 RepID=A0A1M5MK36_9BACT|nr:Signal transduction histidine kinase [Chryseolinea serpens]